jgi:hypothetical protein
MMTAILNFLPTLRKVEDHLRSIAARLAFKGLIGGRAIDKKI